MYGTEKIRSMYAAIKNVLYESSSGNTRRCFLCGSDLPWIDEEERTVAGGFGDYGDLAESGCGA